MSYHPTDINSEGECAELLKCVRKAYPRFLKEGTVTLPPEPEDGESNYHGFDLCMGGRSPYFGSSTVRQRHRFPQQQCGIYTHTSKCIPQTPPTPERTARSPHFKCSLLELVLPIPLHSLKLNLGQLRASSVIPQPTIHLIPRSYRADTRRRAGQDHITRLDETERSVTRQGPGGVGRERNNYGN